jgi:hypothetical protein
MKPPNLAAIAAGAAIAVALTADLTEDQLVVLFLACVVGLGAIYVSEIFRLIK